MSRELMQARFDADTVEELEQYAEDTDISRSEALRRAVREGVLSLARDADDTATDDATELYTARQTGTLIILASMGTSAFATILTLVVLGMI